MLDFLGEKYYLDIDELEYQVSMVKSKIPLPKKSKKDEEVKTDDPNQQISVTRYDTFKFLIEVVLTEREEMDENLGIHSAKNLSLPFKFAFNTLLMNKIIKHL
jgi:hypothetical protein